MSRCWVYIHRHVFRLSQDSSVWLGLTSREQVISSYLHYVKHMSPICPWAWFTTMLLLLYPGGQIVLILTYMLCLSYFCEIRALVYRGSIMTTYGYICLVHFLLVVLKVFLKKLNRTVWRTCEVIFILTASTYIKIRKVKFECGGFHKVCILKIVLKNYNL